MRFFLPVSLLVSQHEALVKVRNSCDDLVDLGFVRQESGSEMISPVLLSKTTKKGRDGVRGLEGEGDREKKKEKGEVLAGKGQKKLS
jgi:hypothetical protein